MSTSSAHSRHNNGTPTGVTNQPLNSESVGEHFRVTMEAPERGRDVCLCGCTGLGKCLCSQATYRHYLHVGDFVSAQRCLEREWMFALVVLLPLLALQVTVFGFGKPTFFSMDSTSKKLIGIAGLTTVLGLLQLVQLNYWYAGVDLAVFERRVLDCWSSYNSFAFNSRLPLLAVVISTAITSGYVLAVLQGELGYGVWITCGLSILAVNLQWFLKGCGLLAQMILKAAVAHYFGRRGSNKYSVAFFAVRFSVWVIFVASNVDKYWRDDDGEKHISKFYIFQCVNAVASVLTFAYCVRLHHTWGRSGGLVKVAKEHPMEAMFWSACGMALDLFVMVITFRAYYRSVGHDLHATLLAILVIYAIPIATVEIWGRVYELIYSDRPVRVVLG